MPKEYHWKSTDSIKESIKRGHGELVKKLSSSLYSVDIAAEAAAGIGDFELVKYFIGSGAKNFSRIMLEAGRSGSIDIINYLLDLKKSDFEALLEGASVGGHPKIVDFALKNGAKDVQGALAKAVSGGNKEVVKLLLSWGATLTPKIIRLIVKLGNDELLDLLDFKNIDANDLLSETISDKMIQYLEERLEQELNLAREERNIEKLENLRYYEQSLGINSIVSAISNKNIELLIRLANRWKNWDYILYEAAKKGDLDIVKLAVENGADEFKDTLLLLARSGNIFLFKYLFDIYHEMIRRGIIQRGFYVREFHESLFVKAGKGGNVDIMTMILRGYRFKIDSEMLRKILRHRHYDAINLALSVKMYD